MALMIVPSFRRQMRSHEIFSDAGTPFVAHFVSYANGAVPPASASSYREFARVSTHAPSAAAPEAIGSTKSVSNGLPRAASVVSYACIRSRTRMSAFATARNRKSPRPPGI